MRKQRRQKGFSMIEVVLMIMILSIAIPSLLQLFTENTITGAEVQILPTAKMLAARKMEEVLAMRFDEQDEKGEMFGDGNWARTMGPGGGEVGHPELWNDVDDFNGSDDDLEAPYEGYSVAVTVSYVSSNNLTTPLVIPAPIPDDWTPSYKLIEVTVDNPGLVAPVTLTTVVTEVQAL